MLINTAFFTLTLSLVVSPTDDPESQSSSDEEHDPATNKRKRHAESLPPFPVAAVIIYKSLGQLLPEHYDPDRRSLRYRTSLFSTCPTIKHMSKYLVLMQFHSQTQNTVSMLRRSI